MSRRSARILSRRCSNRKSDDTELEVIEALSRKRKADEDSDDMLRTEVTKRRKQCQVQSEWRPIASDSASTASVSDDSSSSPQRRSNNTTPLQSSSSATVDPSSSAAAAPAGPPLIGGTSFRCVLRVQERFRQMYPHPRASPLPQLDWADPQEVWDVMLRKELLYDVRSPLVMARHPNLAAKMRAILLDWLNEVSEVYRLHRESFYLAVDFFDRYMAEALDVQKGQLQLLGITCLFIAAKLEEIYPPKLQEFAYVTDGACTEGDIVQLELVVMKMLRWDLTPTTPCFWLNVYLQLLNYDVHKTDSLVLPQYSQHAFVQLVRLLDLCMLETQSQAYRYSVLAAAALYHLSSTQIALYSSGYEWEDIEACVEWMAPFAMTLREAGQVELKFFQQVAPEATHHIQTHVVNMDTLDKVHSRVKDMADAARSSSPETVRGDQASGIITPPQSTNAKASSTPPPSEEKLKSSPTPHSSKAAVSPAPLPHAPSMLNKHAAEEEQGEEQENNDPQVATPPNSSPPAPHSPRS